MSQQSELLDSVEIHESASIEAWRVLEGQLRSEQNFPLGLAAGFGAAALCAVVWAGVTAATEYQIGWMAVGVGVVVALAVRFAGRGLDKRFGVAGAGLALLGCLAGNLLAVCYFVSAEQGIAFAEVMVALNPSLIAGLMEASFQPMDLLFYAIAVYEGYRFSFRQLPEGELELAPVVEQPRHA